MIKRVTLCSIAFILTYCIIYAVSYNGKKEEIEQKINGLFAANAHSFADTLYYTVKVHETMMLELANRAKGKDSVATITLYKESEKLLQIKFKLTL